ncbi:hypothetical protein HYX16_05160 [Candidatus Woesearchaeota archaeon]|nr:hypothetical protein [Candidatus Woesearchaeota archaeon]
MKLIIWQQDEEEKQQLVQDHLQEEDHPQRDLHLQEEDQQLVAQEERGDNYFNAHYFCGRFFF